MIIKDSYVPEWMLQEEKYSPKMDHDGFIIRSLMKIMSLLSEFRSNAALKQSYFSTRAKLIATLLVIILECTATNMFFVYIIFAGVMVVLSTLKGQSIRKIIGSAMPAAVFSALIVLPAFLMGNHNLMVTVVLRVFISVTVIGIMSVTSPWNEVTGSLKVFHLPDIFILTFDLTLKFIMILGDICTNMMTAIRLRSVGKNNQKESALSGVMGTTFLKSHQMSEELYGAMICRGFDGKYNRRSTRFNKHDIIILIVMIILVLLFIFLNFMQ